jgi:hypothetical protein
MPSKSIFVSNVNLFDAILPVARENSPRSMLQSEVFILDTKGFIRENRRNLELQTTYLVNYYKHKVKKVHLLQLEDLPSALSETTEPLYMDFIAFQTIDKYFRNFKLELQERSNIEVCTSMADILLASLPIHKTIHNPWLFKIANSWKSTLKALDVRAWAMPLFPKQRQILLGAPVELISRQSITKICLEFLETGQNFHWLEKYLEVLNGHKIAIISSPELENSFEYFSRLKNVLRNKCGSQATIIFKPHPNSNLSSDTFQTFQDIFSEFNIIPLLYAELDAFKAIPMEVLLSVPRLIFYFGPLTGSVHLLPQSQVFFIESGSLKERMLLKQNYRAFLSYYPRINI